MKSQLLALYQKRFGHKAEAIADLRADGSNRLLYRMFGPGGERAVGVFGPDAEENRAFLSFSRSFRSIGLPVPEIYAADEAAGIYIEEDLGDITLFAALDAARAGDDGFPADIIPLYHTVVDLLPRIQIGGGAAIDFSVAYPCEEFDRKSMAWDLNYFKYHFLKLARIPFNEARLEADFERLCDFLLLADRAHFLYRDFQSRNIMIRDGEPWLIDYQGGRRGALQYDIASLLYDAKAAIPEALRATLLDRYIDALSGHIAVDRERFIESYRGFVLIRIMQAMGAYGYRGFFEKKPHFLASVPYAVANISTVLRNGLPVDLPELKAVFERIVETMDSESSSPSSDAAGMEVDGRWLAVDSRNKENGSVTGHALLPTIDHRLTTIDAETPNSHSESPNPELQTPNTLTVTIASFSYRDGYPAAPGDHGGGFVFDCRSLHNPGRYEPYKALCGRDRDVIDFLEREEGVARFWESVRTLVEPAVENYIQRGFSDLMVSFGCTGGQHRSVYFAERLARHLRQRYPGIEVALMHREEGKRWGG